MNSRDYFVQAERDATIANALASALRAMSLINGNKIEMVDTVATIQLEDEMLKLHEALLLLGIDSNDYR